MQKTALPLAACLLAFAAAGAHAQTLWKWRDASGQMHISDTAPPPGTPAKNIISGPPGGVVVPAALTPAMPASAASAAAPAASSALEKKKAAADKEKADQAKADRDAAVAKNEALRKDNCARAQTALSTMQSGQRIATIDSKGERQIMDDDTRAAEIKRLQQAVSANCGAAPAAQ